MISVNHKDLVNWMKRQVRKAENSRDEMVLDEESNIYWEGYVNAVRQLQMEIAQFPREWVTGYTPTSDDIKELRRLTGESMMRCKEALEINNGDMETALEYIRNFGLA